MPSQFLHQLCVSYPIRNGAKEKIVHLRLSWIELIHQSLNRALAYLPHPASQTLVVMYSSATMCRRGFFKEILIKSHLQASLILETLDAPMQQNMRDQQKLPF